MVFRLNGFLDQLGLDQVGLNQMVLDQMGIGRNGFRPNGNAIYPTRNPQRNAGKYSVLCIQAKHKRDNHEQPQACINRFL